MFKLIPKFKIMKKGGREKKVNVMVMNPKSLVISQWIYLNIISYNIERTIAIQNATFKLMKHLTSFVAC
jgi:ABC-type sulfate transport system substrate-binding protein